MICRTIAAGPVTVIVCGSRARAPKCSVPGCAERAEFECDAPVARRTGASKTCDAKLCAKCRHLQPDGKDFCMPHDRLAAKERPHGLR